MAFAGPTEWEAELKKLQKQVDERLDESPHGKRFTEAHRSFLKNVLVPLLGKAALQDGKHPREWVLFQDQVVIPFGDDELRIVWTRVKKPELDGKILLPRDLVWGDAAVEQYAGPVGSALVESAPGLKAIVEPRLADGQYMARLAGAKATAPSAVSPVAAAPAGPEISAKLKGAVPYHKLERGKWYLHPQAGMVEFVSGEDGAASVYVDRARDSNERTVRLLRDQQKTVFASPGTPAWTALSGARADEKLPLRNVAVVFAYNHLFNRAFQADTSERYERLYKDAGRFPKKPNLKAFVVALKDRLLFHGVGAEQDYSDEAAFLKDFGDRVYAETGEDIVRSGILMRMDEHHSGDWEIGQFFHDKFRIGDVAFKPGDSVQSAAQKQLGGLSWDMEDSFVIRNWDTGRNALVGEKTLVEKGDPRWFQALGEYYPVRTPEQKAHAFSNQIKFLKDIGSPETASEIVSQNRKKIEQMVKGGAVDLVIPIPGGKGREAASYLLAKAVVKEFGLAESAFDDAVAQRPATSAFQAAPQHAFRTFIARLAHVGGRFAVRPRQAGEGALRGKKILLVDDVATTHTTLEEVKRLLLAHGAEEVKVLVAAQSVTSDSKSGVEPEDRFAYLMRLEAGDVSKPPVNSMERFARFRDEALERHRKRPNHPTFSVPSLIPGFRAEEAYKAASEERRSAGELHADRDWAPSDITTIKSHFDKPYVSEFMAAVVNRVIDKGEPEMLRALHGLLRRYDGGERRYGIRASSEDLLGVFNRLRELEGRETATTEDPNYARSIIDAFEMVQDPDFDLRKIKTYRKGWALQDLVEARAFMEELVLRAVESEKDPAKNAVAAALLASEHPVLEVANRAVRLRTAENSPALQDWLIREMQPIRGPQAELIGILAENFPDAKSDAAIRDLYKANRHRRTIEVACSKARKLIRNH